MPTCPNGHQSAADDWCEVCGHRMSGAAAPAGNVPPPPPPYLGTQPGPTMATELCPQCRTPREAQAPFCEECRYNFLNQTASSFAPPPPPPPNPYQQPAPSQAFSYYDSSSSQLHREAEPLGPDPAEHPVEGSGDWMLPPPQTRPTGWYAVIAPDREYFRSMMNRSGPEAAGLNLPAYSPEQRLTLTGPQITIGRRRHSTGESPDIDLSRPPEDPGVSHQHAMLVEQPDGSWAVVDQDSTNGTTINGSEDAIQPYVPVPLRDGDRVHVGAWTTITVHRS
ncbi:FHA domain-containing protein [Streptomyces sp. NPDC052396]|uniref:FHA domain-containing protein n=1 Tax=Streptomyces sp. NPDC052396 TaxID=3365689 RepID=UPI0037CDD205